MGGSKGGWRPPKVLRAAGRRLRTRAERAAYGFFNGIDWWTREPTDVVDRTPYDVVHQDGKLVVRRYRPLDSDEEWELGTTAIRYGAAKRKTPVLLIPPLMVKPFIFDLTRRRSLVRTMLRRGFDVFLVDFGEPDRADEMITLDDYVLSWMPAAIDVVIRESRAEGVATIGYCMGGLFSLMHTSVNRDARVRALVTIASPIDSHEMGILSFVVKLGHDQIDTVARRLGNVPGRVSASAFKMISPVKNLTRYADLFLNMWNDEYVNGFDALTAWTSNFVDYPGEAFRQFLEDFVKENKLKDGQMVFGDDVADLSRIEAPLLAFAGRTDKIVPVSAARKILDLVSSDEKGLRVVSGGHMGVFAGRRAPAEVWEPTADWLVEQVG